MMGEHDGHRQRLMNKLGVRKLCDHEYLEILLYTALPRRNTNDLAHRLMANFGDLMGVLSAPKEQLEQVEGIGKNAAAHIFCVGEVVRACVNNEVAVLPKRFDNQRFLSYVKQEYVDVSSELLDIYFIDADGNIYKRKTLAEGSAFTVSLGGAEFAQTCISEHTSGIVLVHTHPSGNAKPSVTDDETTGKCQQLCALNGVLLCDHVIYGKNGIYSYYLSGRLSTIAGRAKKEIHE